MPAIGKGISPYFKRNPSWPPPTQLGTLFNFDFTSASGLTDFTQVKPNSTISLTGGFLRVVQSPGTGIFSNYITYDTYGSTFLQSYNLETIFSPKTVVPDSYGLSIGLKRTQAAIIWPCLCGFFETVSTADKGKLYIMESDNANTKSSSVSNLVFSVNDRIKLNFSRAGLLYTFTAENLTNPNTISITYSALTAYGSLADTPNTIGKPALFFSGGTQDVEYLKYTSVIVKNGDSGFVGDSITVEYGVPTLADSWPNVLMTGSSKIYFINASVGATSLDILGCINELRLLAPRYMTLTVGVNDLSSYSIPLAKTYIQAILAGVSPHTTVILNYLIPNGTTDPAAWNAMIDTINATVKVDLTTVLGVGSPKLPNPIYYNLDLVHPNAAGAIVIAAEFFSKYPQLK